MLYLNDSSERGSVAVFVLIVLIGLFIIVGPAALAAAQSFVNSNPNLGVVRTLVGG